MILTVPTGPILAKNRPKLSSVIFDGRFDSRQAVQDLVAYDEQVRRLP